MKLSMAEQEKDYLLIQVTAWGGFTVHLFQYTCSLRSIILLVTYLSLYFFLES
jgi:hypothetical protein